MVVSRLPRLLFWKSVERFRRSGFVTRSNFVICEPISRNGNAGHISLRLQTARLVVSCGGQPHSRCCTEDPEQGWRNFWGRVPKLSVNFEEMLSPSHRNFQEQNKVLRSSIIILLLLLLLLMYRLIIVQLIHSKIIKFQIKSSSRNSIRKQTWQYLWQLVFPAWKEDCKTFCPTSCIRTVTARPAGDPAHRSRFVEKCFTRSVIW